MAWERYPLKFDYEEIEDEKVSIVIKRSDIGKTPTFRDEIIWDAMHFEWFRKSGEFGSKYKPAQEQLQQ